MYGTRDAPQIWQEVVESKMKSLDFQASGLHPSVYCHHKRGIILLAHVDDFLCMGSDLDLKWLYEELIRDYTLTSKIMGLGADDVRSMRFLNRIIEL